MLKLHLWLQKTERYLKMETHSTFSDISSRYLGQMLYFKSHSGSFIMERTGDQWGNLNTFAHWWWKKHFWQHFSLVKEISFTQNFFNANVLLVQSDTLLHCLIITAVPRDTICTNNFSMYDHLCLLWELDSSFQGQSAIRVSSVQLYGLTTFLINEVNKLPCQ